MTTSDGHTGHEVRATYDTLNEARSALLALERKGVEADEIELEGPGAMKAKAPLTGSAQHGADMRLEKHLERRAGGGIVIGAVIGAIVGLVGGSMISGTDPVGVLLVGALAGAALGVGLGFLWGGFTGLAVDEGFADTYAAAGDGETIVVVHADGDYESVVDTLRGTNPSSLQVA